MGQNRREKGNSLRCYAVAFPKGTRVGEHGAEGTLVLNPR